MVEESLTEHRVSEVPAGDVLSAHPHSLTLSSDLSWERTLFEIGGFGVYAEVGKVRAQVWVPSL